jgi:hypothetical protein
MTDGLVLRSGGFEARMDEDGWIVDVEFVGERILDAVYAVPRELDWETPSVTLLERGAEAGGALQARFEAPTRHGGRARWSLSMRPSRGGLRIDFTGTCDRSVDLARFGPVLLHAGSLQGVEAVSDGTPERTVWPRAIMPHPVFSGNRRLELRLANGALGIHFDTPQETEDHRNWSDPGWKTYSPPLAQGPVQVEQGRPLRHSITLVAESSPVHGQGGRVPTGSLRPGRASLTIGTRTSRPLLGTQVHSCGDDEAEVVARLGLDFVVCRAGLAQAPERFELACGLGERLGIGVEFQVLVPPSASAAAIAAFARAAAAAGSRVRLQPFEERSLVTTRALLDAFGASAGGSALYYAELNRAAGLGPLTTAVFGAASQVHQVGSRWMLRTPPVMAAQVADARRKHPGSRVGVMPVVMTSVPGADPGRPDPRYRSPIAAGWLAGVLAATVGADQVAVLSATGPAGLAVAGSPTPAGALLARQLSRTATIISTSVGGEILALATQDTGGTMLTVANTTAQPVQVGIQDARNRFPASIELGPWQVESISGGS